MTISEITTNYYDVLTTPFLGRRIALNARLSIEEKVNKNEVLKQENVEIVTKADFYNIEKASMRTTISPNASYKSNKEIVENSISGGLSPLEAVNVYKAQQAYGLTNVGSNPSAQLFSAEVDV